MDVRACRGCRRLFHYIAGEELCPECKEKMESKFQEVRDYIADHENVTARQIIKDCNITMLQLKNWLGDDRLHIADEMNVYSCCEVCGKEIFSGSFCNVCKRQIVNGLGSAMQVNKKPVTCTRKRDTPKMRFIKR